MPVARAVAVVALAAVALLAACTPAPSEAQNLQPPPVPRVIGSHLVRPDLNAQIDAFFANDFADAFRNRRAMYVTVAGSPVAKRYHRSVPGAAYDVGAITTALLATLVGIAIEDRRIRDVDQTVAELLPQYRGRMALDMERVTLGELMSMTAGLRSDDEAETSGQPTGGVADILATGPAQPPGRFAYSSSSTVLVAAILARAVGAPVLTYAQQHLFDPLGIRLVESGDTLRLAETDVTRIGTLWLDGGRYGGRQVVPALWVGQMTRAQAATTDERTPFFGYGVWLTTANGHDAFAATGLGGQLIEVVPELELVVVVQSATDLDGLGASLATVAPAIEYIGLVDGVIAAAVS
jgi:CubicO group peptidase (beta-lactamase class C family)